MSGLPEARPPMLYELAITPDVFDADFNDLNAGHRFELRELLLHLADVGMVANLDDTNWRKSIEACLDEWPATTARSALKDCIVLLANRHRLAPHPKRKPEPATTDDHWLELIRQSHKRSPFDWVVTGERVGTVKLTKSESTVGLAEVRQSEDWKVKRSRRVQMSEQGYRDVLPPLLRHARRLDLVDPYLSPRRGPFFDVIRICMDLMRPGNRGQIVIHTTIKNADAPSVSEALSQWEKRLGQVQRELERHHSLQIVLWRANAGEDDMHDRYLLTDQCGVAVQRGFWCGSNDTRRKTTWSLLDDEDRRELLLHYQQPQSRTGGFLGERFIT